MIEALGLTGGKVVVSPELAVEKRVGTLPVPCGCGVGGIEVLPNPKLVLAKGGSGSVCAELLLPRETMDPEAEAGAETVTSGVMNEEETSTLLFSSGVLEAVECPGTELTVVLAGA